MPNLTNSVVASAKAPEKGYSLYWDDKLKGFGLKVTAAGHKSYLIQYRNKYGCSRRYTIGKHGPLNPTIARKRATQLLADISRGHDPVAEKKKDIKADSMKSFCEQCLEKHFKVKCKPRTIEHVERVIEKFIVPEFGTRKVADMDRSDIHHIHYKLRNTPTQANHVLQILSKMFNLAEKWGLRPDYSNPVRHVEKYPTKKRERYLSFKEVANLSTTLIQAEQTEKEPVSVIACIRLLIFTGCRLSEIQMLKWDYVDMEQQCLRLPDSKTGPKTVQLNPPALEVLQSLPRLPDNPYVIFGTVEGQHLTDMQKPWRRIRKQAGLDDVRLHDLRHTFASVAIGMGENLRMIGKLLGHTQVQTTDRYAHLAVDPQKAATQRIGAVLAGMMTGQQAEVIQLPVQKL